MPKRIRANDGSILALGALDIALYPSIATAVSINAPSAKPKEAKPTLRIRLAYSMPF
jgi:hypothetical protein